MNTSDHNLPLFRKNSIQTDPDPLFHETMARREGFDLIAGVDEAGRGPLAGPVVAAAVMIPEGTSVEGVRDSKKMTAKARERAFDEILDVAIYVSIGVVSHVFIDQFNILKAALEAMKRAVLSLEPAPDYLLVDGIQRVPVSMPQMPLKKGDQESNHSIPNHYQHGLSQYDRLLLQVSDQTKDACLIHQPQGLRALVWVHHRYQPRTW